MKPALYSELMRQMPYVATNRRSVQTYRILSITCENTVLLTEVMEGQSNDLHY